MMILMINLLKKKKKADKVKKVKSLKFLTYWESTVRIQAKQSISQVEKELNVQD